ncbi:MAG: hypothetical protein EA424_02675 [Planctomycetaceae bacterium]|nr:MAG: hypothetical protein EA424_02675 [Planctomycetaceae bacterium]
MTRGRRSMAAEDKPQTTVTCPHCDHSIPPGHETCPHCGEALPAAPQPGAPRDDTSPPDKPDSPPADDQWLDRILEDYD